jgi:hypothetical protein
MYGGRYGRRSCELREQAAHMAVKTPPIMIPPPKSPSTLILFVKIKLLWGYFSREA